MAFYHFLILFLLLLAIIFYVPTSTKNKRIAFLIIGGIILFIIAGFRNETIGNDSDTYVGSYKKVIEAETFSDIHSRFEPGYLVFSYITSLILPFDNGILIASSFVILLLYLLFIYKESKNFWLSIYLLVTLRQYYALMNTIRNEFVVVILLFAYRQILNRNFKKFLLLVLLATSFHSIAIFFIFAYPLGALKFNLKNVLIQLSIYFTIYFLFNSTVLFVVNTLGKFEGYLTSDYFREHLLASWVVLIKNSTFLLFMIYCLKLAKKPNELDTSKSMTLAHEHHLMLNLIFTGVMISFLALKGNILGRLASFYLTYLIVFIPNSLYQIKNSKERLIFLYLVMLGCLAYHTTIFIYRPSWNRVFPYLFFWQ